MNAELHNEAYPNCRSAAKQLEVSPKTIQRDIDFMRDQLGFSVEYNALQRGFFYSKGIARTQGIEEEHRLAIFLTQDGMAASVLLNTMTDCPSLQRANESRRRAWKQMQQLRGLLEGAGVPMEAAVKPADFEHEGAALRAALSWLLLDHADRLNCLTISFRDFRLTHEHEQGPVRQADACAVMEHLLTTARLPAGTVEEMRKASGYKGRNLEKIIRQNRGVPLTKAPLSPRPIEPPSEAPG